MSRETIEYWKVRALEAEDSLTVYMADARADERGKVEREGWQDISTAPKDGTYIIIWFVHANAKFCKDPIAEGYAAPAVAKWIDFNGGGWTWNGLCGVATYWKPLGALPAPPAGGTNG